ncbi:uncharacterized SAM-binding protein YcdF (DUF218 family) [Methanomicrobium sp. W14]|uniref:hypothetical protein n=1 Tax=Methanomicrobium sp. W14 TaxID=2817839 RepID=UPI001AE88A38|nr:hypothetical protein [Methanomicrobium sp. W14]MBP2133046.1 uncharacterized SAM-binding protein YcdF (DUF218 family) [Methanomicrobium sp. W14]
MRLNNRFKNAVISGVLIWLICFLLSLPFYSENGLNIDIFVFKSIMIVSGSIAGALLLVWYYKCIDSDFFMSGVIFGTVVLFADWVLDLVVLCALFGEDPLTWFGTVGVRYLSIPAMSIAAGYIAGNVADKSGSGKVCR